MIATTQLSFILDEILSPTPDYYQFWLTKDQRERVEEIVEGILEVTDKKPKSALFKWKSAVYASRFITKTMILRARKRRYQDSIASLCCGLCTDEEMATFLIGEDDVEMVDDIDQTWVDETLDDGSSSQPFRFSHLSIDSFNVPDFPSQTSSSVYELQDSSTKEEITSVIIQNDTTPYSPSPSNGSSRAIVDFLPDEEQNSEITPIARENLPIRMRPDLDAPGKTPLTEMQDQTPTLKNLIIPTEKDVIFGRGATANNHPGNIVFRRWVDELKARYMAANGYKEKTKLSLTIINRVHDNGGRFLVEDDFTHEWIEADLKVVKNKCSQRFRERKSKGINKS